MNLAELRAKLDGVKKNIRNLQKLAKNEKRDLTDDENTKLDELLTEAEDLKTEITEKAEEEERAATAKRDREERLRKLGGESRGGGGTSFRGPELETEQERANDPVENPDATQYSFYRALECLAEKRSLDGYEGEISQEIAHRSGRKPSGFYMPTTLPAQREAYVGGREFRAGELDTTAGATMIVHNTRQTLIDFLRNETCLFQLGAQSLTGLVGELDIPKETNAGSTYWVGELTDVGKDTAAFGEVQLRTKTIGGYAEISRKMRNQTSIDLQLFSMRRLMTNIAIGIDKAGLNGSGNSGQPLGLMQNSNVPKVVIGSNGGALTWAKVVEHETLVSVANAASGRLAYLTSARGRGHMKVTEKSNTTGQYLWQTQSVPSSDGMVNGYRAMASNQVPTNLTKGTNTNNLTALIFGDFSQLLFGFWSGIDVTVDALTKSKQGTLIVSALQDLDAACLRDNAFAICSEIDTGVAAS